MGALGGAMDRGQQETLDWLEQGEASELGFIELVIAASEASEDQQEIADLVDGLVDAGRWEGLVEV